MIKVLSVFGTRPEAIKMAPLVKALEAEEGIDSYVCVTGQHREMLDQVINLFDLKVQYDLNIMAHGQTIIDIISKAMYGLDKVYKELQPDLVLVHGDTSTTFVGAKVAYLNQIPVGHVEAGLRSGNDYSPFPEEMNRKLTGTIAAYHFSPTEGNRQNLLAEGVDDKKIFITGNTVIDAFLKVVDDNYVFEDKHLAPINFDGKRNILLTCHRRENWGKPMEDIFEAILEVAKEKEDVQIIYPMHMNPNIRKLAHEVFDGQDNIKLIEALDYAPFANLINKCDLILTDSGGLQEEAPALGKPVLVLRTETERPEAVVAGTVRIVGVDKADVLANIKELLENEETYKAMHNASNPYGDGKASQRIVAIIKEQVKKG